LHTDETGKLSRIVGIIQDITETRLAEKAVKVSQTELQEAQTIAKIGNWKFDNATKNLTWSDEVTPFTNWMKRSIVITWRAGR
jgi:two-component system sensor histidine kinase/response regulator